MSNNNLKIRIQIQQQPPQAIEEIYPEPEVVYEQVLDWKKIAAAAALLTVVLSLLGYLIFGNGTGESLQGDPVNAETGNITSSENTPLEFNAQTEVPIIESGESNAEQTIQSIPVDPGTAGIADRTVVIPRKKPGSRVATPASMTTRSIPKTVTQPKPHQTSDQSAVLRAQLSNAVVSRAC